MQDDKQKNLFEKDIEEKQLDRRVVVKLLRYVKPYKYLMALTSFYAAYYCRT